MLGHESDIGFTAATHPATRWLATALRQALRNLYDPVVLRRSPLIDALGLDPADGCFVLHQLLLDDIAALQPSRAISPQSDAWRTYQILYHRYVDQFSQTEVAASIGVSERQLRRLERLALVTLAEYLRAHHPIILPQPTEQATGDAEYEEASHTASPVLIAQEARVLEQFSPSEPVNIRETVSAALETLLPLFTSQQVRADYEGLDARLNAAAHPASLRQALLIVLASAARAACGGRIAIRGHATSSEVYLDIRVEHTQAQPSYGTNLNDVQMASELVVLSGGRLEVEQAHPDKGEPAIRIALPSVERKLVLVVDDNADTLQLISRYLVGTNYAFTSLREPLQAIDLADRLQPILILLDVMLPGLDGWEVLARLREHPRTRDIPVVICTVLPQEQLALSLGAAGFLRKPVIRDELLRLLDNVVAANV